jgi:flagellar protein FlgJ
MHSATFSLTPSLASTAAPITPQSVSKISRHMPPEKIAAAAKQFESSMISALLGPMFEGLSTAPPFGGGEAEGTLRSFLVDAMSKQVEKTGGLHLSSAIQKEMLRMQGGSH